MKYGWKAIYPDGKVVKQYPFLKAETSFKVVLDDPPKFFLVGKYGVNLETGAILFNGQWLQVGDKDGHLVKGNLVYFRRNWATLNAENITKRQVWHFIGFDNVKICIPEGGKAVLCIG